jgi:hypothetical protein
VSTPGTSTGAPVNRVALLAAIQLAKQRHATAHRSPFARKVHEPKEDEAPAPGSAAHEQLRTEAERQRIRGIQMLNAGGFGEYARRNLRIRTKLGRIEPFVLNDAQLALLKIAEEQEDRGQPVRVIVLKARQMGISTMIGGRQYWRSTRKSGQETLTIAHEVKASQKLLRMIETYHDLAQPDFKPAGKVSSGKINFPRLRSSIEIATAQNLKSGRSFTCQSLHGSEVAFWRDASSLMGGAMQSIPMTAGTEIWLESTAIGPSGYFYSACQAARKSEGDGFRFAFLPWYMDKGYVAEMTDSIAMAFTAADEEYQQLHHLSEEQMAYRARKLAEFRLLNHDDEHRARTQFAQEYPACPEDAFNADLGDTYIRAVHVIRAREAFRDGSVKPTVGAPKIMGVDPSWHGNDSFRVWMRQGRHARRVGAWDKRNTVQSAGRLMTLIKEHQPDIINIDAVGIGAGVYDQVADLMSTNNLPGIVYAIMAGSSPDDEDRYVKKRDECWGRMKEWLTSAPQVAIDDVDGIQADLTSIKTVHDGRFRTKLESKDEMRKAPRSLPSPDDGDSLSLTFAFSDVGTMGRAGVRSSGSLDPHRSYSWKVGG